MNDTATDSPGQTSATRKRPAVEPEQVGAADAARLAGVSEATWWRLHAAAKVPKPNRLGGRTLWQLSGPNGLREWIRRGCPARDQFENGQVTAVRGELN